MEKEFAEFGLENRELGVSEKDEDKALEDNSSSVGQQLSRSRKASTYQSTMKQATIPLKATKTVWNAATAEIKKKKDIFLGNK